MANNSQLKVHKQPERRCLGCMQSFPKKELIRVVRTPDGAVELDFQGKKSGRGAYICKNSCDQFGFLRFFTFLIIAQGGKNTKRKK